MDVSQLPFNRLIGLEPADPGSGFQVTLPAGTQYTNHLGTVHGSALLAVAEAGSGAFLVQAFGDRKGYLPVVRHLEAKFRRPASGRIASRCVVEEGDVRRWTDTLETRGRVSVPIAVEVLDGEGRVVMSARVEWFISRIPSETAS
jgi:acyl-coenzyme A thioesterase PaaI-like protein